MDRNSRTVVTMMKSQGCDYFYDVKATDKAGVIMDTVLSLDGLEDLIDALGDTLVQVKAQEDQHVQALGGKP